VLEITFKRTRSRETVKRYFLRYSVPDIDNTVVVGGLKSGSFTQWVLKDILGGKTQSSTTITCDQAYK
jgi:hypothetical protein